MKCEQMEQMQKQIEYLLEYIQEEIKRRYAEDIEEQNGIDLNRYALLCLVMDLHNNFPTCNAKYLLQEDAIIFDYTEFEKIKDYIITASPLKDSLVPAYHPDKKTSTQLETEYDLYREHNPVDGFVGNYSSEDVQKYVEAGKTSADIFKLLQP